MNHTICFFPLSCFCYTAFEHKSRKGNWDAKGKRQNVESHLLPRTPEGSRMLWDLQGATLLLDRGGYGQSVKEDF